MPPQQFAIVSPGIDEVTKVGVGGIGAVMTGVVEGVIIKMAPQLGAAAPIVTWAELLGTPLVGAIGALVTRGMISDLLLGVAHGGTAILGYTLPSLLAPGVFGGKGLTAEQRAALAAGRDVKQLGGGASGAALRAQESVKSSVEF